MIDSIKKGTAWAIIPARSGSKGIKDKNIRDLNGHPIISYSIAAAKVSSRISRVIVSTDSREYMEIARKYGAEVPFIRPDEISGDSSTDLEFMEHAINWIFENERKLPEFWVHLRCTTPLRDPKIVDEAIERIMEDNLADSLRSAHKEDVHPYKWFIDEGAGYYSTLMGNTLDEANNPRQKFPDVYVPDGYVDVLRTSHIVKNNTLYGNKMIAFHSPKVIDLDSLADLEAVEIQCKEYRSPISEFLDSVRRCK